MVWLEVEEVPELVVLVVADLEDVFVLFLVAVFLVAVGAGTAFDATGAGVACCVGMLVKVLEPVVVEVPVVSEVPPSFKPLVVPNCGGVIARTAPRPPTVPPAIKKNLLLIFYLLPLLR